MPHVDPDKRKAAVKASRAKNRESYNASVGRWRRANVHRQYGLSREELDALVERSGNACEICRASFEETKRCIDHDHITGDVRGLLCRKCNAALGLIGERLNAAARYLGYKLSD